MQCLFLWVFVPTYNSAAKSFRESLANRDDTHFKYCNKVWAGWDFGLTDVNNAYLKHRGIHYEMMVSESGY